MQQKSGFKAAKLDFEEFREAKIGFWSSMEQQNYDFVAIKTFF